jgi:gamma-glutamyltranspeptidase/glutathione hydrolase/leukotriene-C4 hydrolase
MSFSESPLTSVGTSYYHRLAEAFKHTFAMRMSLGDPAFVNITAVLHAFLGNPDGSDSTSNYLYNLYKSYYDDNYVLSSPDEYGGAMFNHLNNNPHAFNSYDTRINVKEDHGTSHFACIDRKGLAVSITTTINTYLGSKVSRKYHRKSYHVLIFIVIELYTCKFCLGGVSIHRDPV